MAAPLILFYVRGTTDHGWLALWVAAAVLGPLVFQLISRPRPEWGQGLAFAAALGVVFGTWDGMRPPFEYSDAGQAALIGLYLLAMTFLGGWWARRWRL